MNLNPDYDAKENTKIINDIDFASAHKIDIKEFISSAKIWGDKAAEYKRKYPEDKLIPDQFKANERRENGLLGERAVEKFLQVKFVDLTISNSRDHAKPDLRSVGIDCGVKSAQMTNCPLIKPSEKQPQIIVHIDKVEGCAYICGVAPSILFKSYLRKELVKDNDAKRDGKLGFYGHSKINQFQNINDLQLSLG